MDFVIFPIQYILMICEIFNSSDLKIYKKKLFKNKSLFKLQWNSTPWCLLQYCYECRRK